MTEIETINCLMVRRALLSDPYRLGDRIVQHLQDCTQCQQFAANIRDMDADIHSSLDVDIPAGLADKILLAKGVSTSLQRQKKSQQLKFALASLMLTLSSIAIYFHLDEPTRIEQIALAHVQGELHHLEDRENIQLAQLNTILRAFNMKLESTPNIINYAGTCQIHNSSGAHIVFQGEHAPITMLLMPGEVTSIRKNIMGARFKGIILPLEKGSIALITDKSENLSAFERQLYRQLSFI